MNVRDLVVDKFLNFTPIGARVQRILDLGAEYDAKFTFFVTAKHVEGRDSKILHDIVERGHELGSHSYEHVDFANIDQRAAVNQIERSLNVLEEYYPVEGFRAPYLKANVETLDACADLGLKYESSNRGIERRRYKSLWSIPVTHPQDTDLIHSNNVQRETLGKTLTENIESGDVLAFHPWRIGADRYIGQLEYILKTPLRFGTLSASLDDPDVTSITFDLDFVKQKQVYFHTFKHLYRSPHRKQSLLGRGGETPDDNDFDTEYPNPG